MRPSAFPRRPESGSDMQKAAIVTNPKQIEGENPLADFARLEETLPGHNTNWIKELRRSAASRFTALGFPSQKVEAWKYTGLSALATQRFAPVPVAEANRVSKVSEAKRLEGGRILVFESGHFRPDLSDLGSTIDGVELTTLANVLNDAPERLEAHLNAAAEHVEADAPFDGLNLAMMSDGAVIEIGEDRIVEPVIQILHLGGQPDAAHHLRHLIRLKPGSRATIVESWIGETDGPSWTNAITEIDIGEGAHLAYVKMQDEAPAAFHLGRIKVRLAASAKLDGFVLSTGSRLARSEVMVEQAGERASATINGVYIARDGQHLDQVTRIDHAVPNATSDQLFKGVLGGKSRAAFQGNVIVRPDAQKTDARQANHSLLLSRQAEIDTKPELEIYADDVKCAHGATVGELDAAQLHYLMSRGIPEAEARALLIEAFVAEVAETIENESVREHVLTAIRAAIAEESAS